MPALLPIYNMEYYGLIINYYGGMQDLSTVNFEEIINVLSDFVTIDNVGPE